MTSKQLKKAILYYSTFAITITGLVTSLIIAIPLYSRLQKEQHSQLNHQAQIKAMVIEEFLSHAKDTSRQITSRTQIRKKLELYNKQEINLVTLKSFTAPKLTDAMKLSEDVIGISRLDSTNNLAVQVGKPIPKRLWLAPEPPSVDVLVQGPVLLDGKSYIVLSAPILGRSSQRVGTDIVLFRARRLQQMVENYNSLGDTGETILGRIQDKKAVLFFPLRTQKTGTAESISQRSPIGSAFLKTSKGENGLTLSDNSDGKNAVIAFRSILDGKWGLLVRMNKDELYYSINKIMFMIGGAVLILIFLGAFGMMRLLDPLTGKILMHAEDLETKIEEKTSELKQKTQSLLDANQQLEKLATTDSLTGLANRRYALQALEQLWNDDYSQSKQVACLLIDADKFKEINDTFGHDAGDIVLCELATQLKFSVRTDDIVCRLGGDEFLIICPNTDEEGLMVIAEKMHAHIRNLTVQIPGGVWHGSISVGAAIKTASMRKTEDLIKAADKGVYAAKSSGKNCVKRA